MNTVQPIAGKKSASLVPALATDDRVLSVGEWATIVGLSLSTARRRIADGTGPRIIRLSERRIGIRVSDHRAWLDARSSASAA